MTGLLCGDARVMTAPAAVDPLLADALTTVRDERRTGQAREGVESSGWIGGGFWLPMLHEIAGEAQSDVLDGRRFWWSRCGAMCVELPVHTDLRIPVCTKCFDSSNMPRIASEFVWFPQQQGGR
jgi:hypothetical protein